METGNLADWFSVIGTVISAIVALYLGLRKNELTYHTLLTIILF